MLQCHFSAGSVRIKVISFVVFLVFSLKPVLLRHSRVSKFCTHWKHCSLWQLALTGYRFRKNKEDHMKKIQLLCEDFKRRRKRFRDHESQTSELEEKNTRFPLEGQRRAERTEKHFASAAAPLASSLRNRPTISANLPSGKDFFFF